MSIFVDEELRSEDCCGQILKIIVVAIDCGDCETRDDGESRKEMEPPPSPEPKTDRFQSTGLRKPYIVYVRFGSTTEVSFRLEAAIEIRQRHDCMTG